MNVFLRILCFSAMLLVQSEVFAQENSKFGHFVGEVVAKWLVEHGNDRRMELLADLAFIDQDGKKWVAPKGWIVDGASIPRFLWTIVGSPYTGGYRRASVIHDYYCDKKSESWQAVHKMFYWASLAGGVSETEAKILYAGVYAGGPRWKLVHYTNRQRGIDRKTGGLDFDNIVPWSPSISNEKVEEINAWIKEKNPSIEEIENKASAYMSRHEPPDTIQLED